MKIKKQLKKEGGALYFQYKTYLLMPGSMAGRYLGYLQISPSTRLAAAFRIKILGTVFKQSTRIDGWYQLYFHDTVYKALVKYFRRCLMNYIGIDLHSNRFTCCFLSQDKQDYLATYSLNETGLKHFLSKLSKDDYVLLEASSGSFSFYDLVKDKVKEVLVANPLQLSIICKTSKKTDKVDAKKLATMLKYHIKCDNDFLPLVYVPEKNIRELRALYSTYELYKKQRTSIKNRIRSILRENLKTQKAQYIYGPRKRNKILSLPLSPIYKFQLEELYLHLDNIDNQIIEIKKMISSLGRKYEKEIKILTSIHGVSVFIALALKSDYADIKRFKNAKHFTSYLRAAPKVKSSNETVHNGSTNKRGRKLSISLLIQSLQHFKNVSPKLNDFYDRKRIGKSAGKVRMAVVRKMFVAIYYMLRDNKYFYYYNEDSHKKKLEEYEKELSKFDNLKKVA